MKDPFKEFIIAFVITTIAIMIALAIYASIKALGL